MPIHYLGSETDDELFKRLRATVIQLGGSIENSEWALGGSQEITTYKIILPTGTLKAEAETYTGLSLIGEEAMIATIVKQISGG